MLVMEKYQHPHLCIDSSTAIVRPLSAIAAVVHLGRHGLLRGKMVFETAILYFLHRTPAYPFYFSTTVEGAQPAHVRFDHMPRRMFVLTMRSLGDINS